MKKRAWTVLLGGIAVMAGLAAPARASSCAQIDISGAKTTTPSGINSRGDVAGQFTDAKNVTHGFLIIHRSGQVTVIDVPGATATTANGINSRGDVVGRYDNATGRHGYLLSQGQFTTFQFPGFAFSAGAGINARGDMIGNYGVTALTRAFTLIDGVYSSVDVSGATTTSGSGIDDSGDLSGSYVTSDGVTHGFILNGGAGLLTVDAPGARLTFVRGITQSGHLAMGSYSTDATLFHGLLYQDGMLTPFDYPGAATTTVRGVNSRGDFVGDFNTDGSNLFHGYVCRLAVDGVLPVAASAPGAFGTSFKTAIKLHNPYESPISGTLIFRRQAVPGSSADPTLNYKLAPYETRDYPDLLSAMGQTGLGSVDLIATTALVPVASARIYNDRDPMGIGVREELIGPELALLPGEAGALLAPDDLQRYRFNIGVRTVAAGGSITVTVRDRTGVLRKSFNVAYPGDYFFQLSADAFVGLSLQPGDSIRFAVTSGRAVVYGATADNTTQQFAIGVASRSVD